jgi:hypothetical protein
MNDLATGREKITWLGRYPDMLLCLPKETRVLAHNVHNVGGNDCLVVLALLLFTEAQQILTSYMVS